MKDLLAVPDGKGSSIQQGIAPSLYAANCGLWRDGRNIEFRDGAVAAQRGKTKLLDAVGIREIAQAYVGGQQLLYYADDLGIYEKKGLADPELVGGSSASDWSLEVYGSILLASNRRDTVYYFQKDENGIIDNLPGSDIKIISKLEQYVVLFNIDGEGDRIAWSGQDDPFEWALDDPTKDSGDLNLRDLGSDIQAVAPLGNGLAVYSADRMGILSVTSDEFIMGFHLQLDGIGAVSHHAVVSRGFSNYGMSRNGLWVTDGTQFHYIDRPAIGEFLQSRVDWNASGEVVAYNDEVSREIIWSYRSVEGNLEAIGYNYDTTNWTVYDSGFTAAAERDVFGWPLVAGDEGNVLYQNGTGQNVAECWIESGRIDFGQRDIYKRLQASRWGIEGEATLELGVAETPDDPIEWYFKGPLEFDMPLPQREGLYFVFRISGAEWKLSSLKLRGLISGSAIL